MNNDGRYVYNTYNPTNAVKVEEMSEERKAYLLEKEKMIRERNRKRKIFFVVFYQLF